MRKENRALAGAVAIMRARLPGSGASLLLYAFPALAQSPARSQQRFHDPFTLEQRDGCQESASRRALTGGRHCHRRAGLDGQQQVLLRVGRNEGKAALTRS